MGSSLLLLLARLVRFSISVRWLLLVMVVLVMLVVLVNRWLSGLIIMFLWLSILCIR